MKNKKTCPDCHGRGTHDPGNPDAKPRLRCQGTGNIPD